jgi:hypothetical protein
MWDYGKSNRKGGPLLAAHFDGGFPKVHVKFFAYIWKIFAIRCIFKTLCHCTERQTSDLG